jgi:putative tryptophan/tyrosine transport system substrate-binding protein
MRRRQFIAGLSSAAAWPLVARAQQPTGIRRIGVMLGWSERDPQFRSWFAVFVQELARLGWIEGVNLQIEQRWTDADIERTRTMAKELVALGPDVVLTSTTPVTAAVRGQTDSIPIVFTAVVDPIGSGFVASLARPGGNITGFINIEGGTGGKWLQMLKEIAPGITRAAAMFNPDTATFANYFLGPFEAAAQALAVETIITPVRNDAEIEAAIAALGRERGGLVIVTDSFMGVHRSAVISAAARNKVPAIFEVAFFAREGGLISFGPSYPDFFRRAAGYVDRLLKGEKPTDLPVQVPSKYELVINLRTAREFGLTVPNTLLVRADEVIE